LGTCRVGSQRKLLPPRLSCRMPDSSRLIVLGWINDTCTKRAYGSNSDAYRGFQSMLASGHPPGACSNAPVASLELTLKLACSGPPQRKLFAEHQEQMELWLECEATLNAAKILRRLIALAPGTYHTCQQQTMDRRVRERRAARAERFLGAMRSARRGTLTEEATEFAATPNGDDTSSFKAHRGCHGLL